ncbi:exonuclease V subunit alpha [Candidatus Magnetomorum sp. HK-1]|nr:exonuclease V subunit alpha [Candidatus Magnetomorum sp. HK-1]
MGPRNIKKDQAERYYYQKDHFHAFNESSWFGNACKDFNLSGTVQKAGFVHALDGKTREGVQMVRESTNRRNGIDYVFEAPKSLSIALRMLDDKRLNNAIDESLQITMEHMQDDAIYTRYKKDGQLIRENTGNMIASIFPHSTSRSCINSKDKIESPDMHEHRHVVIMNVTKNEAGKWLAIDNQPIFDNQRYYNTIFQSELSKRVQSLGYGIALKENGNWELAGIKQEWIDNFSKRKFAIDERFQALKTIKKYPKMNDAQLRDIAALETRMDKELNYTQSELVDVWSKQINPKLIQKSVDSSKDQKQLENPELLKEAYEILHTKTSTFTRIELESAMMQLSRGVYGIDEINKMFDNGITSGKIQLIGTKQKGYYSSETFASKSMLDLEKGIVKAVKSGFNKHQRLAGELKINQAFSEHQYLSEDQANAIESILSSKDRYNFIQGDAGTGKTTTMRVLNDALKGSITKVRGLTFTGKAALELEQKGGFKCQTLHSFLKRQELSMKDNHLLIVDEASMVNTFQMRKLFDVAESRPGEIQILFVGDWKQLQAIEAGRLFSDMIEIYKHKIIELTEAHRFKTEMMESIADCLQAYQDGCNDDGICEAIAELEKESMAYFEDAENGKLLNDMINEFTENPDSSLIVCVSNEHKDHINKLCAIALMEDDKIDSDTTTIKSIHQKDQPLIGSNISTQYRPGDKLFIDYATGLVPHQICEVVRTSGLHKIIVQIDEVLTTEINLERDKVHKIMEREIEISKGSRVVFTRNDYRLGVRNGTTGKIVDISENGNIKIDIGSDNHIYIDKDYGFIDNGYAVTAYKAQGMDAEKVLFYSESSDSHLLNSELFYVACTRATHELKIFSDDKEQLINSVTEHQYKPSALEFPEIDLDDLEL